MRLLLQITLLLCVCVVRDRVKSIFGKTTAYCSAAEVREYVGEEKETKLDTKVDTHIIEAQEEKVRDDVRDGMESKEEIRRDNVALRSGRETQKLGEWACLGRKETDEEKMMRLGCRWNKLSARLAAKKLYELTRIELAKNTQCEALLWRRKMC